MAPISNTIGSELKMLGSTAADVGNVLKTMGAQLVSDLGAMTKVVGPLLVPAFQRLARELVDGVTGLTLLTKVLAQGAASVGARVGRGASRVLSSGGRKLAGSGASNALSSIGDLFRPLMAGLGQATSAVGTFTGKITAGVAGLSTSLVAGVAQLTVGLASFAAGLVTAAAAALAEAAAAMAQAVADFTVASILTGGLMAAILAVVAALTALVAAIAAAAAALVAAFAIVAAAVVEALLAPLVAVGTLLTVAIAGLTAPFAAVGTAVSAVVAPFLAVGAAANAITAPFTMLQSAVGTFVGALNPSVMQLFNYSLKMLQATIGVAFVPLMQVMSGAMQKFAGALLPLMQALAPILGDLAVSLTGDLLPVVQIMADSFLAMTPLLQFVVDIIGALGGSLQAFAATMRAVLGSFMGFLGGGGLKEAAQQFQDAIRRLTTAILTGIAQIAKAFGGMGFIEQMQRALGAVVTPAKGAVPAATNVGIKGFEQIGKDMAIAAFAAQGAMGGEKEKSTNDWLKDLGELLKDIKDGKSAQPEWVKQILDAIEVGGEIKKWITDNFGGIKDFIEAAKGWLRSDSPAANFTRSVTNIATNPDKAGRDFKRGFTHPFDTLSELLG